MTTAEILAKLAPTLAQEGVSVEVLREAGESLFIRAKRVGPGVPVAFLVKAIAGTLRRYHGELREVVLEEYDPGENIPVADQVSPEFEKVLKHRPGSPRLKTSSELLGLDLRGCDRAQAVRALETAHRIWSAQGVEHFLLRDIGEDAVKRAWEKWRTFYGLAVSFHEGPEPGSLLVHLKENCTGQACQDGRAILWMPARVIADVTPPPGD